MEVLRTLTTTDGIQLSYRLLRAAKPQRLVVLLHGMASNMSRWSEFVEQTGLKESWDILRPDLRGHGESFVRGGIGLERWCEDLVKILDHEGYEHALLIGHSLGAQVAVQFAARYPTRVQGLVLIDPVFHRALRGAMRTVSRFRPAIGLLVTLIHVLNVLGLRRRSIPSRDLRKMDEATRANLLTAGKQQEMVALYSSPWEDLKFFPTASFLQELSEIVRPLPPLTQIQAPILFLLSTSITYTDPEVSRQIIAAHPQAQIVTIDAYHWPLTENPVQVRQEIEQWCKRFPP